MENTGLRIQGSGITLSWTANDIRQAASMIPRGSTVEILPSRQSVNAWELAMYIAKMLDKLAEGTEIYKLLCHAPPEVVDQDDYPTWENTLKATNKEENNIQYVRRIAEELGYKYFVFGGYVYRTNTFTKSATKESEVE